MLKSLPKLFSLNFNLNLITMYSEKKILECQIREQQSKVLNAEADLLSAKEKLEIRKMILRNLKAKLRALPES